MSSERISSIEPRTLTGWGAREPVASRYRGWPGAVWRILKDRIKSPFYRLYLRRLRTEAHSWVRPRHIGIIMDGNRRFAFNQGLGSALRGHERGADKLHELLDWCQQLDICVVTVWCFSIENFERSAEEVAELLQLFEDKTREMADGEEIHQRRVRIRYIGKLELLPQSLRDEIRRAEEVTAGYEAFQLNIAMAYGGREEITDAVRQHLLDRAAEGASVKEIADRLSSTDLEPYLYTYGQPEPDLILRTSGEIRSSGFLLWQSAYSEFYFSDTYWPAFREIDFLRALRSYHLRQRRFGR